MSLFSCPLCGESVEVLEPEPSEEAPPLTCPVCGVCVAEEEVTVAAGVPDDVPRRRRRKP